MRTTALLFSALVLFACSSEAPTSSTRTPTSAANQNGDDKTPAKPDSTTDTDSTDPAPAGGSCSSAAKMDACYECCEKSAGPAAVEILQKSFGDCMCAADKCGTQCAQSACADKEPAQGDACDLCIQQQYEACETTSLDTCEKDAGCKKLFECEEASKCQDKPE